MKIRSILAFAVVAMAAGCNGILGIDTAQLDTSDGGVSGAAGGTPCEVYCDTIQGNCHELNQQYVDRPTCLSLCSHFDPGAPNDTEGNSLSCRNYHAGAAAGDPDLHCHHAGPLGGGVCGADPCEGFCLLDVGVCGTQSKPPYDGEVACKKACDAFDYEPSKGDIALKSGDTLNCRLYHLQAAVNDSPTHCPHTGVVSAPCGSSP